VLSPSTSIQFTSKGVNMAIASDTLTIARSYSEASNAKDWDRLRNDILAPDVEAWSHSAQFLERGPEEIIHALQQSKGAVTDTHIQVHNAVVDGDQAVLELRIRGTAHGDPNDRTNTTLTGEERPVTLSTCHVYKIRDGKIWRLATYSDRTFRFDEPA
jgi:ketosteroid isomerase-like protein